jgi:hypothetical protein
MKGEWRISLFGFWDIGQPERFELHEVRHTIWGMVDSLLKARRMWRKAIRVEWHPAPPQEGGNLRS